MKINHLMLGVLLTILFMDINGVYAANRYVNVKATGTDNGSDWTNAYTSLPETLVRGDTYYLAGGSYGTYTFDDAQTGSTYIFIKKATSSAHGADTGWVDSMGDGQAIFSGWTFSTGYYDISGVTGGGPKNWTGGHGIVVRSESHPIIDMNKLNLSNIHLRHIEAYSTLGPSSDVGINMVQNWYDRGSDYYWELEGNGLSDSTVEYCYWHDITGVFFHTRNMNNVLIQYNMFYNNGEDEHPPGVHREAWSAVGDDKVVWRWNYLKYISNTAIFAFVNGGGVTNGIEIYGNVFEQGSGHWASMFVDAGDSNPSEPVRPTNWKIYNNTLVGWNGGAAITNLATGNNNLFYNNILAHHPDLSWDTYWTDVTRDYDGFYSMIRSGVDVAPEKAAEEAHGQLFTASPFVNYIGGDFRLIGSTKPGIALPSPYNVDMFGNVRGSDGIFDRGAYEYQGIPNTRIPNPPTIFHQQ